MMASKSLTMILIAVLAIGWTATVNGDISKSTNLLSNPNLAIGQPLDWERDAFGFSAKLFTWLHTATGTVVGISIPRNSPNDVRWIQKVQVAPNTDHVLSGQIRTEDVEHSLELVDAGANLSILEELPVTGSFTFSDPLLGDNPWTRVELHFNTGTLTEVTVALRVGMFAGTTTGKAWFRRIKLRRR